MVELSEVEKAYLAGILDGEGCITVSKGKYDNRVVQVYVAMCDKQAIDLFHDSFGGCIFYLVQKNPKWTNSWRWSIKSQRAKLVLLELMPYLRVKRRQAETALELIGSFTHIGGRATIAQRENQQRLHERIKSLNQREIV